MANRPEREVSVTVDLVRALVSAQRADLADLPISELSRGWDNTNFRLGPDLMIRVPHRQVAAPLIAAEQQWLPVLAPALEMHVPVPVHHGSPTDDYPWPWSITPFFPGAEAAGSALANPAYTAERLGRFFAQLHQPAPVDAPANPYRGVPLRNRAESFASNLALLGDEHDHEALAARFDLACQVPAATERVWLHGDMHGRNLIVNDGELAAVIDWGDVCAGDRATDLAVTFSLVPAHLDIVKMHAGATDADWQRARGWALNFAVIYLGHSDDDPVMEAMGTRLLHVLCDDGVQ